MKKNIIIFGASGHSKVIVDILEKENIWNIMGFIDSFKREKEFFGYPILGTEKDILKIVDDFNIFGGIVAIGDNFIRFTVVEKIKNILIDFKFISTIHPSAILGKFVKVGDGTTIMAGTIINADTEIGEHSIINSASVIEHDSKVGDFSTIAPNVSMGGGVRVGNFSTISIGATIKHSIKIGNDIVIGANSLLLKDIFNKSVWFGNPAKFIRKRERYDKYL